MHALPIRRAAVIGSGVMGKGIAAHLANCGIPSLLLDVKRELVAQALAELPKARPALLYDPSLLRLITPGSIAEDLPKVADCDWVIEVIVERLEPKQALYAQLETHHHPGQIVSSNTSGISWVRLTQGRSAAFKRHFCITHFFNPVRYMKLVELVGGPDTDPELLRGMAQVLETTLGKGVVWAKDTPNFVANRIGVHGMMVALHATAEHGWPLGAVDKVMGPATGRPKSAVFRTADLVGIDTLAHVARTSYDQCPEDEARQVFVIPAVMQQMIDQGLLGDKTKRGFYAKGVDATGQREIQALDFRTMQYATEPKWRAASLGAAKDMDDVAARLRAVVNANDEAGAIAWPLLSASLVYAANRVPEIADDIVNVDRAMEWGFNWDVGPFRMWDALGVQAVVDRLRQEGRAVPTLAERVLREGTGRFYQSSPEGEAFFDLATGRYKTVPKPANVLVLKSLAERNRVVAENGSARLLDVGDGVFCCEFRSKMNAIDEEIILLMNTAVDRAEREGVGLIIGNEGANFCVGANLMLIFLEIQQKHWDRIRDIAKSFQGICQRLRFARCPVVAAPFGLVLGGGCEVVLGAGHARAAAETYIGLVELGVGLIPAGAGCKNMLLRMEARCQQQHRSQDQIWMSPTDGGPFPKVQAVFETVGFAKVSSSALEAQRLGYLRPSDATSVNRDTLLADAKADVVRLAKDYAPPAERRDISLPGRGGYMAVRNALAQYRLQGVITEYDQVLGDKLGWVLTGGDRPGPHLATEDEILEREREAFVSLCGEERTQARIQHLLMHGKPLRN